MIKRILKHFCVFELSCTNSRKKFIQLSTPKISIICSFVTSCVNSQLMCRKINMYGIITSNRAVMYDTGSQFTHKTIFIKY